MMQSIGKTDLAGLFERLRDVFAKQRAFLIELDGKVGDSDLGITMNKAFAAAFVSVQAITGDSIGKTLQLAGMAIAKAAPSTMGTLTATGFMSGGKALGECLTLSTAEWSVFWRAYHDAVAQRGKAQPGDKTVVDVLGPIAASLESSAKTQSPLPDALTLATEVAAQALEATRTMVAQHGKAACFQEQSLGLQDAGATVAFLLIDTLRAFATQDESTK
ncbi:dihydroxyacetone kinase subunit L [Variovorax sp. RTB1]|uniref:dihydroxyacetone kinase subunit L n=1 Tax=Variovorax sp. RTB1 TaxID=3048631 RepID=UPI002B23B57D|nr:dihydroxyacetone kinase subunit L [Variovorax sp. RTB1]MEB0110938.1 dihydroxyacetone kinase subunit L [Variovorax sp. RTB1]